MACSVKMIVTHAILRLQITKEGLNMRTKIAKRAGFLAIFALLALGLIATGATAAEVITKKDTIESVSMEEDFVRTADNFIILFDASGTMQKSYKDTGMKKVDMAKKILQQRNQILPDLGFNAGLYMFTPWKTYYPMQPYDRGKFEQAIGSLATEKLNLAYENQPTPLGDAINNLDPILSWDHLLRVLFHRTLAYHTPPFSQNIGRHPRRRLLPALGGISKCPPSILRVLPIASCKRA